MISGKPFTYAEFKKIYSKVPRLSVDVIVAGPNGIALSLRSIPPYRNKWHVPGSTMLYGESVAETAKRVARNELNVRIHAKPQFLGYIEYNEERQRGFGRSVSLVFLARLKSGTPAPDGDAANVAFFSRLPKNIIREQRKFLEQHLPKIIKG
jgi:ADP-ribose pyrophosphatase YjhB (NUDIX family)